MIYGLEEWTPDRPSIAKGRLRDAKNVVPAAESYEPLTDLASASDALPGEALGLVSSRDQTQGTHTTHTYAGTLTGLYELASDGTWTDRSKVGGYTGSESTRWRSAQYGDRFLTTNANDPVQYIDMSSGASFADLPNAPTAAFITNYGEFIILGRTGSSAFKVAWSEIGDSEGWTFGTNQSDEQEFADGGMVMGLASADVVYVFQEYCIRRMAYIGPPVIMQFDVIERQRGCIASGTIAQLGRMVFFLAEDGFYQFDGMQSVPIGFEKVDEWFKADANRDYYHLMHSGISPLHKLYMVAYVSNAAAGPQPDTLLLFNWYAQRWSYARLPTQVLGSILTAGVTLEDLDAIYGDLDSIPISLDDPILSGGTLKVAAINADNELAFFAGDNLEATFITDDIIAGENSLLFSRACRPLIDGQTYVSVGTRMSTQDTLAWSNESVVNTSGLAPLRSTGRYNRIKLRIPAGTAWTKAEGFEHDASTAGAR